MLVPLSCEGLDKNGFNNAAGGGGQGGGGRCIPADGGKQPNLFHCLSAQEDTWLTCSIVPGGEEALILLLPPSESPQRFGVGDAQVRKGEPPARRRRGWSRRRKNGVSCSGSEG
jgi:hypothetical protein